MRARCNRGSPGRDPGRGAPPAPGGAAGAPPWAGGRRLEALANLAHELRTPLQVLFGYLDILREEWAGHAAPEPRRILGRMQCSAYELAHTVENLLEFAAAEAGGLALVEEDFSLADLIGEIRPILEAANASRGLRLVFDLRRSGLRIRSARRLIRSILLNLALNAIKFTAAGSVVVAARGGESDGHSSWVEFAVRDSGTGIDPALMNRAFEPFVQLSGSSTRHSRGLGLGLALVRRNVEALGGTLEVDSREGGGSSFVLRIPNRRRQAGQDRNGLRQGRAGGELAPPPLPGCAARKTGRVNASCRSARRTPRARRMSLSRPPGCSGDPTLAPDR